MYLMSVLFCAVGIVLATLMIIVLLLRQKSPLIFDKYPRKGFWYYFKYRLALLVLKHLRRKFYAGGADTLEKFDRPQTLTDNPQSYDVVSFMGANEQGEKLIITLERRRRGVIKACLYIHLPGKGLYCLPNLPDMVYFTTNGRVENPAFKGVGFHIYPEQSMRTWHVLFEGDLKNIATEELLPTKLDLKFTTGAAYFNYNRDLSASVIADSVARESWNDSFFGMLKRLDQILATRVHYEQNGAIDGNLKLGDHESKLKLKGFRDHSFGTERCLSTINRYVYFSLFLEDGTSLIVGNLSQPSFFLSSLKVGYVCTPTGVYQPITRCNFELYAYGEKGSPPKHKHFIVETEFAKYFVQIDEEDIALRFMGGEWHSKVFNQFVKCTVNGVKGYGLTEYLYRNEGGRPDTVSSNDPEWYQQVRKFERTLSTGEARENDEEVFLF